jgi:hypothetical protein
MPKDRIQVYSHYLDFERCQFYLCPLRSTTNYRLNTEDGYELLYRRLTSQPKTRKPTLGKLRTWHRANRKQVFSSTSQSPEIEESSASHSRLLRFFALMMPGFGREDLIRDLSQQIQSLVV